MKRIILLELCLLFLATTFQGDRLIGWVQQTIPTNAPVVDLQFLDTLTGFIVSSKSPPDSAFIYKTTDGGNNWTSVVKDKLVLTSIHFPSTQTGYCVGYSITNSQPVILKTSNSGNNWSVVSTLNTGILYDVCFASNDAGWICSSSDIVGGLWRTTNGGLNWQMQLNASNRPSKIFFINSTTGFVIANTGQNLYKTTNSGDNWFNLSGFGTSIIDVFFTSNDTGWVTGGGGGNGLMRTTNGGNNWFALNSPVIVSGAKLFFLSNINGWAGNGLQEIVATKNGFNWGTQYSPIRNYSVSFVDSLHGWAGYTGLVHTTDGGGTITYTGIKRNGDFIPSFELGQNYPNPFNASTRIKFSILKSCYLDLKIYNIKGQEVASLISGLGYKPGDYDFYFDAGKYSISSGVYFYLMKGATTDNKEIFIDTKRMLMIK